MKKIITITALLIATIYSTASIAHTGHGNNNIFHAHDGAGYFLVMLIVGLLVGFVTYYDYKKNIHKKRPNSEKSELGL